MSVVLLEGATAENTCSVGHSRKCDWTVDSCSVQLGHDEAVAVLTAVAGSSGALLLLALSI